MEDNLFHVKHDLEKIESCPICKGTYFADFLSCKDHNYSYDWFCIVKCKTCGFRFTNPRPKEKTVHIYYQSADYISHTSSKKGILNTIYHVVRNYQFGKKYTIIRKLIEKRKKKILDVGSGTGEFIEYFAKNGWDVKGVETDDKARNYSINNYNCIVDKSLDETAKYGKKFDVITLWHVLEHVYDINEYISKLKKLLNNDGYIILGLPNCDSFDAKYYKENWYAYDLPIHVSHFTKNDIKNLVNKHGLKLISIKPLIFDAYYISMLSERKKGRGFIFGLLNGVISNLKSLKSGQYSSLMYIIRK